MSDPVRDAPSQTATLDSEDPETVWRFLDRAYGTSLRLRDDPGRLTFQRVGGDLLSLDEMTMAGGVAFDAGPFSRFSVIECRTGYGSYARHGLCDRLGPGEVIGIASPGHGPAGSCGDLDVRLLNLSPHLLQRAAADIQGDERELRFRQLRTVERRDALLWSRLVDFVSVAIRPERLPVGGLAEHDLARVVARTVLDVFPNSTWDEPTRAGQESASAAAVRRATAFIDSAADRELTLGDIAAAAHVSPRALQAGFRRHLDTTPMRYLQRARLRLVRRELTSGTPGVTVTSVAARWGFYHHGRFAAAYRQEFGELPSATLGRVVGRPRREDGRQGAGLDGVDDDRACSARP